MGISPGLLALCSLAGADQSAIPRPILRSSHRTRLLTTRRETLGQAGQAWARESPSRLSEPLSISLTTEENDQLMTSDDRTRDGNPRSTRTLGWVTALAGLVAIVAVVALTLMGYSEAAIATGAVGTSATAAGGLRITVNVRH